jgi:amino acid transporter
MVMAMVFGLGLGLLSAPDQGFFTLGTLGTIIYAYVYASGNLGVMRFFLGRARSELNLAVHVAFPVISTIALVLVLYVSLVPLPDPPIAYAPWIALALFCAGLLMLWRLHRSVSSDWKHLSSYVVSERPDSDPARLYETEAAALKIT